MTYVSFCCLSFQAAATDHSSPQEAWEKEITISCRSL